MALALVSVSKYSGAHPVSTCTDCHVTLKARNIPFGYNKMPFVPEPFTYRYSFHKGVLCDISPTAVDMFAVPEMCPRNPRQSLEWDGNEIKSIITYDGSEAHKQNGSIQGKQFEPNGSNSSS